MTLVFDGTAQTMPLEGYPTRSFTVSVRPQITNSSGTVIFPGLLLGSFHFIYKADRTTIIDRIRANTDRRNTGEVAFSPFDVINIPGEDIDQFLGLVRNTSFTSEQFAFLASNRCATIGIESGRTGDVITTELQRNVMQPGSYLFLRSIGSAPRTTVDVVLRETLA